MGTETWRNELIAMRDRAERAEKMVEAVRKWRNCPDRHSTDLDILFRAYEAATPAPGKEP
jgi:hypothetical protein